MTEQQKARIVEGKAYASFMVKGRNSAGHLEAVLEVEGASYFSCGIASLTGGSAATNGDSNE